MDPLLSVLLTTEYRSVVIVYYNNDATAFYSSKSRGKNFKNQNEVICDNCNIKGHTRKSCYKIIDNPPGYKNINKIIIQGIIRNDHMSIAQLLHKVARWSLPTMQETLHQLILILEKKKKKRKYNCPFLNQINSNSEIYYEECTYNIHSQSCKYNLVQVKIGY